MSLTKIVAVASLALCCTGGWAAHKVAKHTPKVAETKPLEPATPEQMQAAERTLIGTYACEFHQTLDVAADARAPGYVDVHFKNQTMVMKPVLSSTGAIRLEDVTGRTLMVQIATKSMLLDTKAGQRIVDDCMHPDQQAAVKPA